jgi:hypothetical protein
VRSAVACRPDLSASSGTSIVGRNGSPVEGGQRKGAVVEESIDCLEIELWLLEIGDMARVRDHHQARLGKGAPVTSGGPGKIINAYLIAITLFRHLIVYPSLIKGIGQRWQADQPPPPSPSV